MNESMLHALMQLFAIIASINRETVMLLARNFVESFLNQELSVKQAEKYLAIFDFYYTEIEEPESVRKSKKTSSLSVKILTICSEINQELHIRNKFRILLSLLQFMKYFESSAFDDADFSQTVSDSVITISDGLMISRQEFNNCRAFITDKFYKVPDRDSVLVVSDDKAFHFTEIKHLQKDKLSGQILVMQIKRADTYLFHYTGSEKLELNGKYIFPRYVYLLPRGCSIRSQSMSPIYYSDISSSFHQSRTAGEIHFLARDIEYYFPRSENGIQKFSFYGESGQLVGIMGGSGTGKSTLIKIFDGSLKLSSGEILINGENLSDSDRLEGLIGNIPQDDLLIEELTVFQNLYFNAKLCLANKTEEEINEAVNNILSELGLFESRHLKVGTPLNKFISGGQRKRLNIALELIRSPYILFVDEPTSGLSSTDSENVMYLLKEQAVRGKLIMVVIHQPSSELFKMFDRLLVLDRGGYPIYQGDPVEALRYFKEETERVDSAENDCPTCGNVDTEEILQIVEAKSVDEHGEYTAERRRSPKEWYNTYRQNIEAKLSQPSSDGQIPEIETRIPGLITQFKIFSIRNFLTKIADRQYLIIALLVTPLMAMILGYFTKYVSGEAGAPLQYVFSKNENLPAYLFMSVIVSLFFGMIISAEEIIKDRKILARESFLNLSRTSYLLSKVIFLFLLSAFQTISFVLIANAILQIKGLTFSYWLILFSTACFANLLGMNISDGLKSVVAIYIVVPFLLVPQILLAGVIVKFDKLHYSVASHQNVPIVGDIMPSRWAYEALAVNQFRNNEYQAHFFDNKQLESNISYNLQHLIPLIKERMADLDAIVDDEEKTEESASLLALIRNSLDVFHSQIPLGCYAELTPEAYNGEVRRQVSEYLGVLQEKLSDAMTNIRSEEKKIIDSLIDDYGGADRLVELKKNYYNESLADLVLNRSVLKKVYETPDLFIRKTEPVYQMPESRLGRAHFFSAYKQVGNLVLDTVTFNVLVLWLMTVLLYIALQFRWLAKLIAFFNNINLKL